LIEKNKKAFNQNKNKNRNKDFFKKKRKSQTFEKKTSQSN
jgi:hypothetical protein